MRGVRSKKSGEGMGVMMEQQRDSVEMEIL